MSTTSTTQPDLLPDMKVATPSVPRGGVMRVEGTTCGTDVSVNVGGSFVGADDVAFRGNYTVADGPTPRPFALGVSVPPAIAPGDYPVNITCWSGDAGGPSTVRSVTIRSDAVDPVVTAVSGPPNGSEGAPVHLVGTGCHSGAITADKARVLVGTSHLFSAEWDEYSAAVGPEGEFVVDAVLPRLVDVEHFPKWFVTAYCVSPDGMNYGAASTSIELAPPAPTTTVPSDPVSPSATPAPELPRSS